MSILGRILGSYGSLGDYFTQHDEPDTQRVGITAKDQSPCLMNGYHLTKELSPGFWRCVRCLRETEAPAMAVDGEEG